MQCFEASIIFRVANCFRCHCHFCLGQTLGTHFRRIPLSTIESMPGARYGVSKEKDVQKLGCPEVVVPRVMYRGWGAQKLGCPEINEYLLLKKSLLILSSERKQLS